MITKESPSASSLTFYQLHRGAILHVLDGTELKEIVQPLLLESDRETGAVAALGAFQRELEEVMDRVSGGDLRGGERR